MSTPKFTVALAAFNEEDWVASAIRSVLAQTCDDFELIVVDDGSTDRTADIIRSFESDPRVRLITQENRGLAASLNAAIAAGSAPYIALIDADDLWMPTYLEEMGKALDADPGIGFAYPDAWCYDVGGHRFWRESSNVAMGAPNPPPPDAEQFMRSLIDFNFVFGLTAIRRSAFEKVGGFNDSLQACEDYELWLRLLANHYRAASVEQLLVVVSDRPGSMHYDERSMLTNIREVLRIVVEDLDSSEEVKRRARNRIAAIDLMHRRLERGAVTTRAWRELRMRLGRVRSAVYARRIWYPGIPPDVDAAFPELDRQGGRPP